MYMYSYYIVRITQSWFYDEYETGRNGKGGRPNINTVLWEHSETLNVIRNKYETAFYMDMQERFARL